MYIIKHLDTNLYVTKINENSIQLGDKEKALRLERDEAMYVSDRITDALKQDVQIEEIK